MPESLSICLKDVKYIEGEGEAMPYARLTRSGKPNLLCTAGPEVDRRRGSGDGLPSAGHVVMGQSGIRPRRLYIERPAAHAPCPLDVGSQLA